MIRGATVCGSVFLTAMLAPFGMATQGQSAECRIHEEGLAIEVSIDPTEPVVGDFVLLTVVVRTTTGAAFSPEYGLGGTQPCFEGDTSTRRLPHMMGPGQTQTITYELRAVQPGVADLGFYASYETCFALDTTTDLCVCDAWAFTSDSIRFTVSVGEFRAGDANCDGRATAADLVSLVQLIAAGDRSLCMRDDANQDGQLNAADIDATIAALFRQPSA